MRWWVAAILVAAVGCDRKEGPAPLVPPIAKRLPPPAPPPTAPPTRPPAPPGTKKLEPPKALGANATPVPAPEGEPTRITVQHVLIAFKGAFKAPPTVTRTREEAKAFAQEILDRINAGEDVKALAKEYSTDPGGGLYTLVNTGGRLEKPTDIPRAKFIKPFTDIAFKLKVGEAGIAEYNKETCPYGWHVIKRLE